MKNESWEKYINLKNLILLFDAAEDLKIQSYELIHKMRRNHPKPLKLWMEFPKKHGDWIAECVLVNKAKYTQVNVCLNGIAFVPFEEMQIVEERLKTGKSGVELIYELKIIPESKQETLLNVVSRELDENPPDKLEEPDHSGMIQLKKFKAFPKASNLEIRDGFDVHSPDLSAWSEQLRLLIDRSDLEILQKVKEIVPKRPTQEYRRLLFDLVLTDWETNGWSYGVGGRVKEALEYLNHDKEYLVISVSPDLVFRKNNGEKQILDDLYRAIHDIKKKLVKNGEVPKEALEKTKKPN